MRKGSRKKGFTLIEVLVVLVILGLLSTIISNVVISSSKVSTEQTKDFDRVSEARIAMSYIINTLHQNDVSNAIKVEGHSKLIVKFGADLLQKKEIFYDSAQHRLVEENNGIQSVIAYIAGLDMVYTEKKDDNTSSDIIIKISYNDVYDNDKIKNLEQKVTLKSANFTVGG